MTTIFLLTTFLHISYCIFLHIIYFFVIYISSFYIFLVNIYFYIICIIYYFYMFLSNILFLFKTFLFFTFTKLLLFSILYFASLLILYQLLGLSEFYAYLNHSSPLTNSQIALQISRRRPSIQFPLVMFVRKKQVGVRFYLPGCIIARPGRRFCVFWVVPKTGLTGYYTYISVERSERSGL